MGPQSKTQALILDCMSSATDDCILWPYGRDTFGYARAKVSFHPSRLAHRIICQLRHGPAPDGLPLATHTCGNGSGGCVNPRHIAWGSAQSNSDDKKRHGTFPVGEKVPRSVLTADRVREIRAMKAAGMSHRKVADIIGVQHGTIQAIHERRTWAHVE